MVVLLQAGVISGVVSALREWPIAVWVVLAAALFFVVEYVVLRIRQGRSREASQVAEKRLLRVATALKNYAEAHLKTLPGSLDELHLPDTAEVAYRPVPRINQDEKLILVHDREPVHQVLEFPALRRGRGVVFCSGRFRVVSEEVWDKLLVADDALRDRLGLDPVGARGAELGDR